MRKPSYVKLKNDKLEEDPIGLTTEFPYTSLYVELDKYIGRCAPWHWHKEFEFFYMDKGSIECHTENGSFIFLEGEGCFINSNVLHKTKLQEGSTDSVQIVQIFNKHLLSGIYNSIFETKYLNPVVQCNELDLLRLDPKNKKHLAIIDLLREAFLLSKKETFGYEFEIRNLLSKVWCILLELTKYIVTRENIKQNVDSERIKSMINYVQHNYAEKIELKDIANAACISERECFRCFKRSLSMTPFEYVTSHRIQVACKMLRETSVPIINIVTACGFSSNSYFGKIFKENIHCTPKTFRQDPRC